MYARTNSGENDMRVNNLVLQITDFERIQLNRTEEVVRILRELADSIDEYGVVNADGMYLKDSDGVEIGVVDVEWVAE